MELKTRIKGLLSDLKTISNGGLNLDNICDILKEDRNEVKITLKELKEIGEITTIPIRHTGNWEYYYYSNVLNEATFTNRIDELFTELGVPPWVKITFFRESRVAFIGEFNKRPGFILIDYNNDPFLIFHDKNAGGKTDEIEDLKKKSRYRCSNNNIVKEYSYNGIVKK